jgi:hypothetical protein
MKMFTDCSGPCCICACGDYCLAGHGDDDFCLASKKQITERLDNGAYSSYRETMINTLKYVYEYNYKDKNEKYKYTLDIKFTANGNVDCCILWDVIKEALLSYASQTKSEITVSKVILEEDNNGSIKE